MHELSIAQDLITTVLGVAEQNDAKQVTRAIVEIGALSGVEPDALTLAWEVVRQDTIAKDSPLEIEHKPLVARCPRCNWQGEVEKDLPICKSCEFVSLEVITGREMRLVSIDID
jgi:hydrogenase nickel incorporation protein HypA/HybF